jgi:hypothetical protein
LKSSNSSLFHQIGNNFITEIPLKGSTGGHFEDSYQHPDVKKSMKYSLLRAVLIDKLVERDAITIQDINFSGFFMPGA